MQPSLNGSGGLITVALKEIPRDLRIAVADEIKELWGLGPFDALMMEMVARRPIENPEIKVPERKYKMVMRGKRPPGKTPMPEDFK